MPFLGQTKTEDGNEYVWDGTQWATRTIALSKPSPYLGGKTTRKVRLINAETDPDMQTQEDFNKSVSGRLDGLDAGIPDVNLDDYATIAYSDEEDGKLDARITTLENAPPSGGGGLTDAPSDGEIYARQDANWVTLPDTVVMATNVDPGDYEVGQLFWDTNPNSMELYVKFGQEWVVASPPVSLEGIETDITNLQDDLDTNIKPIVTQAGGFLSTFDVEYGDVIESNTNRIVALEGATGPDLDDYVKKSGDQMSGNLHVLEIPVNNANIDTVPFVVAKDADNGGSVARFRKGEVDVLKINGDGNLELMNNKIIKLDLPEDPEDATNKFYTDAQDTILHGMVDVIVGRKVYAKYQLQKDDKALRSGKFKLLIMAQHDSEITQANDWEDVNYIYFSYDDYDGHRRALTELKVGDQLSMESPNGAGTFIISQTKVNGLDTFFGVTRINFVGDPTEGDVYQMVAGDEGRITAEQVGEIVLNRFNAVDAVRNSYGKIFTGVQSYDPNSALEPGTIAWNGGSDMYISDVDSNNFSWCSNTNATFTLDSKQYFTIYGETSGGQIASMHMRGSFTTFFKNSNHVKLGGVERLHGSSTLYNNKWYIVNLGGFM